MPNPLSSQFDELRRRLRACYLAWGVSWLVLALLGSLLVACLGDWLFHFDDAGVRLILALCVLGVAGWIGWRRLVLPLRSPVTDLDLALRIEGRYPGFHDSLASTVQFLEGNADPRVGSPALQRAVVARTIYRFSQGQFDDLLETREIRRLAAAAVGLVLLTALLATFDLRAARTALARLAWPFAALEWPRETSLRLLDANLEPISPERERPLRVARGETLKIYAENAAGKLPARVTLEYRFPGTDLKPSTDVMRPTAARDAQGAVRELALGQLALLKRDVEIRAVGGDDQSMPFVLVEVIPPPVVEQLAVTLIPPAYSGRPQQTLPSGVGHVEGLLGTEVLFSATASKPLHRAALRLKDAPPASLPIGPDGRSIAGRFMIKEAGTYSWWLELTDAADFTNVDPPRYDVRGVPDADPEVAIVLPAADQTVTADAVVPVRVTARDDLAVRAVRLRYKTDWGREGVIELPASGDTPQEVVAEFNWHLAAVEPIEGGSIRFHAEATDDYRAAPGLNGPETHLGLSTPRTLSIVSKAAKSQQIAQQQSVLALELERVARLQTQAREQLAELDLQLQSGQFREEDVDALKRTEIAQRDITNQLTGPAVGLERKARDLLEDLENNNLAGQAADARLDVEGTRRRLESMADELQRLGSEHLGRIEQDLTQARKALEPKARQARALDAGRSARDVTGANRPSEASGRQPGVNRPERAEIHDQPALPGARRESGAGQRGQPEADDAAARARQRRSTAESAEEPAAEQPQSRSSRRGLEAAPRDSAGQRGRERGDRAARGQVDSAADQTLDTLRDAQENQQAVLESLNDMLAELGRWRSENDVAQELSELVKNQAELNQKTSELGGQTLTRPRSALTAQELADLAKLAERQKKQAERADQLERRLREKVEAAESGGGQPAQSLRDAQERASQERIPAAMREAAAQIQDNRMGEAGRTQSDLLDKLRDLENTLHNRADSDAETLVKKLKDAERTLDDLRSRQEEVLRKLDQARQLADPAQRDEALRTLQREQQQLREETARLARLLVRNNAQRPSAAARRAAQRMQEAGDDLEQGDDEQAAGDMRESLDDLEQAQRELAEERQQAEERLARELLDRVANELRGMIPRQQALLEESQRLDALHQAAGKWSRAQLLSLRQAADAQRLLKEETDALAEKLSVAEVFSLALKGAARAMDRAALLLQERSAGEETQRAQTAARQRFIDLVDSLKQDDAGEQAAGGNGQNARQGGGGEGGEGPDQDGIPALAQVKMLITLQRDLLARLDELNRAAAGGALSEAQRQELEALADEQGQLADLTRDLSARTAAADDDAPDPDDPAPNPAPADGDTETLPDAP